MDDWLAPLRVVTFAFPRHYGYMERVIRIDTLVAFCALLVSLATAVVLSYQTRLVEEQYTATIWPYIDVDTERSASELRISLTNNGLGPALIRSAVLSVDGRTVPSWTALLESVRRDPALRAIPERRRFADSSSSLDAETAIRPGNTLPLLVLHIPSGLRKTALSKQHIAMQLCYCSLNDRCWTLQATIGGRQSQHPNRTASCPETGAIDA
jgi:hypothetical protein